MQDIVDFYKANRKMLVRVASRRVGPDWAEDAVHDAFERALKYYPTCGPVIRDLKAWFNTILNRACLDINKSNRNGGLAEIQEDDWIIYPKPDDVYFLEEILDKIKDYPEQHRQVLYCAFALQYREDQIVKITGLSLHNVNLIRFRFMKDMRERYGEDSST